MPVKVKVSKVAFNEKKLSNGNINSFFFAKLVIFYPLKIEFNFFGYVY